MRWCALERIRCASVRCTACLLTASIAESVLQPGITRASATQLAGRLPTRAICLINFDLLIGMEGCVNAPAERLVCAPFPSSDSGLPLFTSGCVLQRCPKRVAFTTSSSSVMQSFSSASHAVRTHRRRGTAALPHNSPNQLLPQATSCFSAAVATHGHPTCRLHAPVREHHGRRAPGARHRPRPR